MDRPQYPTFIFQVNINCCKGCPKKLKKLVLNLNGVDSVEVEPEKKLVYVRGKVDPKAIIKLIKSKMNKIATLVPEEKLNNVENNKNKTKNGQSSNYSDQESEYCCSDGDCDKGGGHKQEAYRGPWRQNREVNEEICRDKYCMIHNRNSIMRNHPMYHHRAYGMQPPYQAFGRGMQPFSPMFGYGYNANDFASERSNRGDCTIM